MNGIEYDFVSRARAKIQLNGPPKKVDLIRADLGRGKYEVIMGCGQDPQTCGFRKPKTCLAPITLEGKKHQITAVLCGRSAPDIERALAENGGIKSIPLVNIIRISSRKRYS